MNTQYTLPPGLVLAEGDEVMEQIGGFTIVFRAATGQGEVVVDHGAFASRQERRAAERSFMKAARVASQGMPLVMAGRGLDHG